MHVLGFEQLCYLFYPARKVLTRLWLVGSFLFHLFNKNLYVHYVLGTFLNVLQILIYYSYSIIWCRFYYFPFYRWGNESPINKEVVQHHSATRFWNWDLNPSSLTPELVWLNTSSLRWKEPMQIDWVWL